MRIGPVTLRRDDGTVSIRASVRWEDCSQPDREIFIETEDRFAEDLGFGTQAFLVGCLIPALHFGERRIAVEEPVCPLLLEGLETVMALMREWSGKELRPLRIEAPPGPGPAFTTPRAGLFLSGGIDSLAALRLAMLRYPPDHPARVRDLILVHGFDIGGVIARGAKLHVFDRAKEAMAKVAKEAGAELIPVYTNIRHLCDDRDLWLNRFFGAVLAAVAHAFASRLTLVFIASSYDLPHLHPCGSHPMLDPEFSSYGLRILHRDVRLSRMEKLRIVSSWETAFHHFRVCLANVADRLNCGRCEKCVRTMLELEALGLLSKTRAFVEDEVDPALLDGFRITIRERAPFYKEMLPLLEARGRTDLADKIRQKLTEPGK